MEKKEENYIRQLLLELDEYLFSLRWYDKEDREIMLKNIIGFDSIFQIIPKRFRKLLEGRIYTQEELDKAREEGYQDCLDDIWEEAKGLRGWTEHDGSISATDIEAGLQEAYLNIESKLKDNK